MSNHRCPLAADLEIQLLEQDHPDRLPATFQGHVTQCRECAAVFRRVKNFEHRVQDHFREVHAALPSLRFHYPDTTPTPPPLIEAWKEMLINGWREMLMNRWKEMLMNKWMMAGTVAVLIIVATVLVTPALRRSPELRPPSTDEKASLPRGFAMLREGSLQADSGDPITCGTPFAVLARTFRTSQTALIRLDSGISVLAHSAAFSFNQAGIALTRGTIDVLVPKKGLTFSASTPSMVLGVRGTKFVVTLGDDDITRVSVSEGCVHVATIAGQERSLGPGQTLAINPAGEFSESTHPESMPVQDSGSAASQASVSVDTPPPGVVFTE